MSDKLCLPDLSDAFESGLICAIQSYKNFKEREIPSDAKEFTAYHNACKAALMHIALLMKLIQGGQSAKELAEQDWISSAREALKQNTEENDDLFSA